MNDELPTKFGESITNLWSNRGAVELLPESLLNRGWVN